MSPRNGAASMPAEAVKPRRSSRDFRELTPSREPAADSADRPVEHLCGLFVAFAFQVAEDDRSAVLFGKPVQLLVKHRPDFPPKHFPHRLNRRGFHVLGLIGKPTRRIRPDAGCRPISHSVEPGSQRGVNPDRVRFPDQDQERCLKGVVNILGLPENVPANPHHHRTVPVE